VNVPPVVLSALLVTVAYLVGAIPFGYLTAKWLKGIDIRTVGSGNIGATNVGRVLGFRYFLLVFALDMAKGLLPTWGFPRLVPALTGRAAPPELAVLVGLATILGHNFPVYLKFKGGKGVATSLGALLALDPVAGVASAVGFCIFLLVTRYVSMSSILGGGVFFLAHFARVKDPWSREERAMTIVTIALLILLVGRHRKNFARVAAGTEPKVNLRKKKPPEGRIAAAGLVALAALALVVVGGVAAVKRWNREERLTVGRYTVAEVARAGTGHQRAERVAFAEGGRLLAVTCPRYNRLVLYRVSDHDSLEVVRDLTLDGHPVAVCPARDRLYVLERPPGDERHVQPGWLEAFDFRGDRAGDRVIVGFYPDDLALSPDGRYAFVLTSGRSEGSPDRPAPALDVYPIDGTKPVGRLTFDAPGDDPSRITLSASGQAAAVTLLGTGAAAAVDLFDPAQPRLIGRSPLAEAENPYPSRGEGDAIIMPVASGREAVMVSFAGLGDCVASTLPHGSGLEFSQAGSRRPLGRLVLRAGALGLSSTRPTGLAYAPKRGLIAVANRSGGVHLVAIR
jgi:glycerol-3-phosphate acyltransferase PlsY